MVLTQFLELWNNDNPQMLVQTSGSTGKPKPLWVDKCRMEGHLPISKVESWRQSFALHVARLYRW